MTIFRGNGGERVAKAIESPREGGWERSTLPSPQPSREALAVSAATKAGISHQPSSQPHTSSQSDQGTTAGFKEAFSQAEVRDLPKGQRHQQLIPCRTPDLTAALEGPWNFSEAGKEEGSTCGQARRGKH